MVDTGPAWTAPRDGHDWRDENILKATQWLRSLVPAVEFEGRMTRTREFFQNATTEWQKGNLVPPYDAADAIAWYIFQAETFATDRRFLVIPEMVRIAPLITRLGMDLEILKSVDGVETRARRVMTGGKSNPDNGIFEILVALAYKRRGWKTVEFIAEQPGLAKTPDICVYDGRRRWAVECKRLSPTVLEEGIAQRGSTLSDPVHKLSMERGRTLVTTTIFLEDLHSIPDDYLLTKAEEYLRSGKGRWEDERSRGIIRDIDWRLARHVLSKDDVYFGSSRMIELLTGSYRHDAQHSLLIKWRPSTNRPLYAEEVYHANIVSWTDRSKATMERRSRHFRSVVGRAERQLPNDRPGVIHIGMENWHGPSLDARRHIKNYLEARTFEAAGSRLRWIYTNYFVPELTTDKNESWAFTETMVPYKIGSHSTAWPLPGHLLVSEEQESRKGTHWDGN